MGLELDMAIVLETIKVNFIISALQHCIVDLLVAETRWTPDRDVLPVCVDASVLLPPRVAPPPHQVRAAGPPHAGLLSGRGKQQLLGRN